MITIVDYEVGNIASLVNMLEHVGVDTAVSGDPDVIRRADRLLLPGVGAFDRAMRGLQERSMVRAIREAAGSGAQILGVCLGMQLLARASEEGLEAGLGLIPADVVRLTPGAETGLKVPNIGWHQVTPNGHLWMFPENETARFYFDHGYHMICDDGSDVAGTIQYGADVVVAVSRDNIHGVQFHPEKSHRFGMRLLKQFSELPQ